MLSWDANARLNHPNMNCGNSAQTFAHNYKHKYIRTSSHRQSNLLHVCRFPPETQFSLSLILHLLNDIRVIRTSNLRCSCGGKAFICLQSLIQTPSRSKTKMEIAVEMTFPSSRHLCKLGQVQDGILVSTLAFGMPVSSLGLVDSACVILICHFGKKKHIYSILSKTVCSHKHLVCKQQGAAFSHDIIMRRLSCCHLGCFEFLTQCLLYYFLCICHCVALWDTVLHAEHLAMFGM